MTVLPTQQAGGAQGQPGIGMDRSDDMWCVRSNEGTVQRQCQDNESDINEFTKWRPSICS